MHVLAPRGLQLAPRGPGVILRFLSEYNPGGSIRRIVISDVIGTDSLLLAETDRLLLAGTAADWPLTQTSGVDWSKFSAMPLGVFSSLDL